MPFKKGVPPWNKTNSKTICKYCGKEYHIPPSRLLDTKIKRGVYCSKSCTDKARIGKSSWNKDIKGKEYKKHYPKGFGGIFYTVGKIYRWDREKYMELHHWIRKTLGKPSECSSCKKSFSGKKIQWANKSGEYRREVDDWLRLCAKCHYIYDKHNTRKKQYSSPKHEGVLLARTTQIDDTRS